MNILRENPIETQPLKALRATERLETLLEGHEATLDDILRFVPGRRAIFCGQYEGQPAIFRLALSARGRSTQIARMEELTRVRTYMNDGPFRVPAPLDVLARGNVTITEQVPGPPLLQHLWTLPVENRLPLIPPAAEWLLAYASPTVEHREVRRRPWRNRAQEAVHRQPHPKLRRAEERLLQKMHALARALGRSATWRVARIHGDFHPNNLLLGPDGTLWGIDLSEATPAPIYRDMARFLVHLARRRLQLSDARIFGVDAVAYRMFCDAFALDEAEVWGHLPFFICYETLVRVEHPRLPQRRVNQALAMTTALFDDIRLLMKSGPESLCDRFPDGPPQSGASM